MKLIDADELPVTCNVAIVNGKLELNGWIAAKRIEEAPIVKAIPIEYIEAFKKEFRAVASVKAVIDWLLEKWEKENE